MVNIAKIETTPSELDLDFYRSYYVEMANKSDEEVFQHWFKKGISEGRFPNSKVALNINLSKPGMPDDFDVAGYLEFNKDVAKTCQWDFEAADHYLKYGIAENRHYKKPEEKLAQTPEAAHSSADSLNTEKFDAEFYRLLYPDMSSKSDEKCLEHWLKFGRKENRYGYFEELLNKHKNSALIPDNFSLASYVAKNSGLYKSMSGNVRPIIHFLNSGIDEERLYSPTEYSPRFIQEFYDIEVENGLCVDYVLQLVKEKQDADILTKIYLSATELSQNYGIFSKEFSKYFDHEAYRYGNPSAHHIPASNYAKCLHHFLNEGIDNANDISYEAYFDVEFYLQEYRKQLPSNLSNLKYEDLPGHDDELEPDEKQQQQKNKALLFTHWIKHGLSNEEYQNLQVWAEKARKINIPPQLVTNLKQYEVLNTDLSHMKTPSEYFNHFIKHGLTENRPGIVYNAETAAFFCDMAQKALAENKRDVAIKIYNNILRHTPEFPMATHNIADDLLRHGFHADAARHYQTLLDNKTGVQWSYINLATCLEYLGDGFQAAVSLQKGVQTFPEDINLAIKSKKTSIHQFNQILKDARRKSSVLGLDYARDEVRNALKLYDKEHFSPLREKTIQHITIIGNHDLPQCRAYRIDQKIEHLEAAGFDVRVFKHSEDLSGYYERLDETDAVIFYRVPALPQIIEAIMAANMRGLPTFYEIDDLLFDEALFPPPFESYANQISYTQYASMATDVPLLYHAMSLCRFGIASTKTLQKEMEAVVHSGQVFLHRNAFGSLHQRMANLPLHERSSQDGPVTIFYGSGTKAHKDDFHNIIEPVFTKLHEKHGDKVKFLVLGYISETPAMQALGDQLVLLEPIWDTEDYWTMMRDEADINLSVLSRNLVTDAKSEIKWMEAAMFGIPSVVSNTATHEEVIEDGVTGFLCNDAEGFYNAIDQLIMEPETRKLIGEAARQQTFKEYSIKAQADNIESILENFSPDTTKSKKKRIAVVNVFYPPQAIGGATRVVHDNVTDFISEYGDQAEIHVFTTTNGETPYSMRNYVVDEIPVTAVVTETTENLEQRVTDPQMGMAFAKFIQSYKPDLIHFHCIQRLTSSIVSEARKAEIPYIITAHDGWWISDAQFLVDEHDEIKTYQFSNDNNSPLKNTSTRQRILKKELFGAKHIAAVSKPFAKIYEDTGLENVITVENGVSELDVKPRTHSKSGKIRLAHIGGMSRHKGFHLVRHALMANKHFDNLELLVVDHAAPKGSVQHDVWGSTPVTFIPKVAQSQVTELFSNIDILLAPSIWPESYGLVTREALICGCRVIASNIGSIGECVDHGQNGLIVDVSDADDLGNALAEVNANPEFYAVSPPPTKELRPAIQQARDLAKLYRKILTS